MKNVRKILLTSALSIVISMSGLGGAYADDTDIYLDSSTNTGTTDIQPKIMIIVDNSGSMETNSINVAASYDPATTYTGGSWDATKVYWTTSSWKPTNPGQHYFSKSNLN